MPKQTITIEVDVPEGYEATGEYQVPNKRRDLWLSPDENEVRGNKDFHYSDSPRIILRKKWTPPSWMPEGAWLFKFDGCFWWLSIVEPVAHPDYGYIVPQKGFCVEVNSISQMFHYPDFTPPPVDKIQIHHG